MPRPEQSLFFAIPERDQDRPLWPGLQTGQRLRNFQNAGRATAVIVGSVMHDSERAATVGSIAEANVVVMCANQDVLIPELFITSRNDGEDVSIIGVEVLEVVSVVRNSREFQLSQLISDVRSCGIISLSSRLTALECVAGQEVDVPLQFGFGD